MFIEKVLDKIKDATILAGILPGVNFSALAAPSDIFFIGNIVPNINIEIHDDIANDINHPTTEKCPDVKFPINDKIKLIVSPILNPILLPIFF